MDDGCATRRRHSCIRTTCTMQSYARPVITGRYTSPAVSRYACMITAVSVAWHTLCEPACDAPPDPTTPSSALLPPSPSTACNYSRPLYLHPTTDCENRTGNLTEGQYRRGQRSFCALSSRAFASWQLCWCTWRYLYKISRNWCFVLLYSLKSAYLRSIRH